MCRFDAAADVSKMQQTIIFASFGGHEGPSRVDAGGYELVAALLH
jgi:hypothetical protein